MKKKNSGLTVIMLALALSMAFMLFAAAPALAQEEREEQQEVTEKDVPPELQAKMREFRDAVADLKGSVAPLKADVREFKASIKELLREARSLPRDGKWDLFDQVSALRDEYLGTMKERIEAIRGSAGAMKEVVAAAREAWEREDLDSALSALDQAIAGAGEIEAQVKELHTLFEQVLESLGQLGAEAGTGSTSLQGWAT